MPFREEREGVSPRDVVTIVANSLLLEAAFLLHMSRQIKFRAWDRVEKKMWYIGGLLSVTSFQESEERMLERSEIMQFTGLLDKNGEEIYEGDVLKGGMYIRNKWKEDILLKVEYWCEGVTTQSGFRFTREDGSWEYQALLQDIEIIGNIYENPEFLTV